MEPILSGTGGASLENLNGMMGPTHFLRTKSLSKKTTRARSTDVVLRNCAAQFT
jgi:hypothetical protein